MTSWGLLILAAAVFLGLRRPVNAPNRYAVVFVVVVVAVFYAAVRQHTL
jgi:uncharacterized membrane protein YoaK (UPF0700 family)